jgi:hypothetical protein
MLLFLIILYSSINFLLFVGVALILMAIIRLMKEEWRNKIMFQEIKHSVFHERYNGFSDKQWRNK